jgi:hypothetical protein
MLGPWTELNQYKNELLELTISFFFALKYSSGNLTSHQQFRDDSLKNFYYNISMMHHFSKRKIMSDFFCVQIHEIKKSTTVILMTKKSAQKS